MTDQPLVSLRDIATALNLPESTVRYYRDAFAHHLPTVGTGRRRRYPPEAVATLRMIALWYHEGKTRNWIEQELSTLYAPEIHARPSGVHAASRATHEPSHAPHATQPDAARILAAILDGERERRQALWQMARELVRLADAVERQQTTLDGIARRLAAHADLVTSTEQTPAGPSEDPGQSARRDAADRNPPPRASDPGARIRELLKDLEVLGEELAHEKERVERLRGAQSEHDQRAGRQSAFDRLLAHDR